MTEVVATPVQVETPSVGVVEVSKPVVSSKPYDDDMLEAYEAESLAEESGETPVEPAKKADETTTETPAKPEEKVADSVEETPIKRVINGKEVEFKIKDAIKAYENQETFNRNMDRRFTEVSRREKNWESDQNTFKQKIGDVIDGAQTGDFVTAIRTLAKLAAGSSGLDVTEFEKKYFAQLEKVNEVYTKMTPEQREAYFARRAAAEAKAEVARFKDKEATTEATSELKQQVLTAQQQNGLSPNEFWGNYKALVDSQVGEGKAFKDRSEITTDKVVEYSLNVKHWEKVLTAGQTLGVEDDAILDEVARITALRPDLTTEDIAEVIKRAGLVKTASPEAVENLNRKAGKSRFNSTASSTKKENGKIEGYDEETLSELYRNQPKQYTRVAR